MSGINFLGASSGIDFQSLLESIMILERQPLDRLKTDETTLGQQKDAFGDINGRLDNLLATLTPLISSTASTSSFGKVSATSSDTTLLTATATSAASPGIYDIRVQKLAQGHQVIATAGATVASFTASIAGSDVNPDIDSPTTLLKSLHRRDNGLNVATADIGTITVDDSRVGAGTTIDLAAAGITENSTFSDLLTALNTALTTDGSNASAALNATADGIVISDTAAGPENLTISDTVGTLAAGLGIAGMFPNGGGPITADGGDMNPDLQADTPLAVLRGGLGAGDLASGVVLRNGISQATLDFSAATTVQNILDAVNGAGLSTSAAINAGKNGISLTGTTANRSLAVDENGGTTALDLGIIGESRVLRMKTSGDASYTRIFLNGGYDGDNASLSQADLRDSVNAAAGTNGNFSASLVDGRFLLTSKVTGAAGALQFQDDLANLGTLEQLGVLISDAVDDSTISAAYAGDQTKGGTMTAATDATFSVNGLILNRSKNTGIDDVLTGVTLNLLKPSTSTGPGFPTDYAQTTLTVSQDAAGLTSDIRAFVDQYNSVVDFVKSLTKVDLEGSNDGVLAGDTTAEGILQSLQMKVTGRLGDASLTFRSLFDVVDSLGNEVFSFDKENKLVLDETALGNVIDDNRLDLEKLFAYDSNADGTKDQGILFTLNAYIDAEAKIGGLLDQHVDVYKELLDAKADDIVDMEDFLTQREAALKRQFSSAEQALSRLKAQQTSFSAQLGGLR